MNTKYIMLAALTAMSQSAFAQTTASIATPVQEANTNTSVASDATPTTVSKYLGIKYLMFVHGPGMDFSGAHMAGNNGQEDMFLDHRPKFIYKANKNLDLGTEIRINTSLSQRDNSMSAKAANSRLFATFKNVYKSDLLSLSLTPRLDLPTSFKAHNQNMLPSPELVASLDLTPKNTRWSYNLGVQYIDLLYGTNASAANQNSATTAVLAPWAEADFQLTPKTAISLSYWPEMLAQARQGRPLATDSNEIDIGASYEFIKGWNVNPFIATEMNDLNKNNVGLDKNMQINLAISGAFL